VLPRDIGGAAHKNPVICLTEKVSTCNSGFVAEFRADLHCLSGFPAVIVLLSESDTFDIEVTSLRDFCTFISTPEPEQITT